MFACERLDQYIYEKVTLVTTDHQALVPIAQKPLCTAPKRLQRMLLRLQRFSRRIEYVPGSELYIADTLSRATQNHCEVIHLDEELMEELDSVRTVSELLIKDKRLEVLADATSKDDILQEVISFVWKGWPASIKGRCIRGS